MYVRLMKKDDVAQVTLIDREAFPTEWPPTNFNRELQNRLAYYIVACKEPAVTSPSSDLIPKERPPGLLKRLAGIFKRSRIDPINNSSDTIIGYAGIWIMADEAHIMSIASRKEDRRTGIGEGLLLAIFQIAQHHKARVVTLEVRVSNNNAQNLYLKYGFRKAGMRKGYYLDNKEDAIIMTTDYINSPEFRERAQNLKHDLIERCGQIYFDIVK